LPKKTQTNQIKQHCDDFVITQLNIFLAHLAHRLCEFMLSFYSGCCPKTFTF